MFDKDLTNLLDAGSIIIDGPSKSGKITFLLYLLSFLYKSKAIIFTPQESYLFNRKISSLSTQHKQFTNLKENIKAYFLDEQWNALKQRYGYEYFLEELTHIIKISEEKIIVLHRIGEFFEFQDRHKIENVYKTLIKVAAANNKKIIFSVNTQNSNFEYIYRVAEEFSDISISIKNTENNERILNIKDILHNQEYPLFQFRIHQQNFILDLYENKQEANDKKTKNILIAELNHAHDNMREICEYILNKPNISVKYANSLSGILEEVFISPDVIIIFMEREEKNFETISAIKKHLPDSVIVAIVDQDFVRAEDVQEAYNNGCDELFANNLSLETFILSLQKASKTLFYTQTLKELSSYDNILHSLDDFQSLAEELVEKSLFFSIFMLESTKKFELLKTSSRQNDYLYQTEHKIYYLAIGLMPKDISHIVNNYKRKDADLEVSCIWEPINHKSLGVCIS